MSSLTRFKPRFIRPGTQILESTRAILAGVVLTAKGSQCSLSIHDSSTSVGLSGSATRRLLLVCKATASAMLTIATEFSTGMVVVLGGTDSTATLFTTRRR